MMKFQVDLTKLSRKALTLMYNRSMKFIDYEDTESKQGIDLIVEEYERRKDTESDLSHYHLAIAARAIRNDYDD